MGVIGFDPRGIGYTTPGMFAFPTDPEEANIFENIIKSTNETSDSLGALYAYAQTIGKVTKARISDVAQHVGTPTVARDMLSIVKAFGYDKLQYWGISYGSILGATFVAMFPDNIERLIIDGVADSQSYYDGQYGHELQDVNKVLLSIYQACVDAGPSACPIYNSTTAEISTRIDSFLSSLKTEPVSFYNETSGLYGSLDYSAAKGAIFNALYAPHLVGAQLIFALAAAEEGEGQPLYELSGRVASNAFKCNCSDVPTSPFSNGVENSFAIRCGDSGPLNSTLDDVRRIYGEIAQDTRLAEMWPVYVTCSGWKIASKDKFTASFRTNTSFPVLLIGNSADPITPIAGARKMSRGFLGSVVLTQDSPGHTSMSASSNCTSKVIRDYFREGKLPANGTVCSVESSVFGNITNATMPKLKF